MSVSSCPGTQSLFISSCFAQISVHSVCLICYDLSYSPAVLCLVVVVVLVAPFCTQDVCAYLFFFFFFKRGCLVEFEVHINVYLYILLYPVGPMYFTTKKYE